MSWSRVVLMQPVFHRVVRITGCCDLKTKVLLCAPTCNAPRPWVSWYKQIAVSSTRSVLFLSLLYLCAQARSTSTMVFGASEDRIRGPPFSLITTSSSILTPRPRKCFGAWSLSSQMYSPAARHNVSRNGNGTEHLHARAAVWISNLALWWWPFLAEEVASEIVQEYRGRPCPGNGQRGGGSTALQPGI